MNATASDLINELECIYCYIKTQVFLLLIHFKFAPMPVFTFPTKLQCNLSDICLQTNTMFCCKVFMLQHH